MDTDRVQGAGKQIRGSLKDTADMVVGDAKLRAEGPADHAIGEALSTAGRVKDGVRRTPGG